MKKRRNPLRLTALVLALCLALGGCSRLLNREYVDVTPHNAAPTAEGDPSVLRAESYQELVNALSYFINAGTETGSVRLYLQSEEAEQDMEEAIREVTQEDPLGAYAVEFIRYNLTPVVTYLDAEIRITYRRTPEQVAAIANVNGATAIRGELEKALENFAPELALRISYFDRDEAYIRRLCKEAFCSDPGSALDMPALIVAIYPDSGRQRIVEVLMNYHLEEEELERRRTELSEEADRLAEELRPLSDDRNALLLQAATSLVERGGYAEGIGSTAYHALLEGGADSQGLALAMSLLCERLEIGCYVADGTVNGAEHCWNVVRTDGGWMHLDLTVPWPEEGLPFYTDTQLTETGYTWESEFLPRCGGTGEGTETIH